MAAKGDAGDAVELIEVASPTFADPQSPAGLISNILASDFELSTNLLDPLFPKGEKIADILNTTFVKIVEDKSAIPKLEAAINEILSHGYNGYLLLTHLINQKKWLMHFCQSEAMRTFFEEKLKIYWPTSPSAKAVAEGAVIEAETGRPPIQTLLGFIYLDEARQAEISAEAFEFWREMKTAYAIRCFEAGMQMGNFTCAKEFYLQKRGTCEAKASFPERKVFFESEIWPWLLKYNQHLQTPALLLLCTAYLSFANMAHKEILKPEEKPANTEVFEKLVRIYFLKACYAFYLARRLFETEHQEAEINNASAGRGLWIILSLAFCAGTEKRIETFAVAEEKLKAFGRAYAGYLFPRSDAQKAAPVAESVDGLVGQIAGEIRLKEPENIARDMLQISF